MDFVSKKTLKAEEQNREDVKRAREEWVNTFVCISPDQLVFVDESSAKTNMTRLYGRSAGGSRCNDFTPQGHWHTTTMLSSVRYDGSAECVVFEGAVNGEFFRKYVETFLAPKLSRGDIVIWDNLSSHKDSKAIEAVERKGAKVMFLPPYSPDLNPIVKMWSKVKEALRSLKARSQDELLEAIATALDMVTASDAKGWFGSCGYGVSQD